MLFPLSVFLVQFENHKVFLRSAINRPSKRTLYQYEDTCRYTQLAWSSCSELVPICIVNAFRKPSCRVTPDSNYALELVTKYFQDLIDS